MGIIIGTDEAGYGPNLGPLVISASAWRTPAGLSAEGLYQRLAACVTDQVERGGVQPRIAMADSKRLFQPAAGLAHLERGVLAALGVLERLPTCWTDLWPMLAPECDDWRREAVHDGYDAAVPVDLSPGEVPPAIALLAMGLQAAGVELLALRSRPVFPGEFNALVAGGESKGAVLSRLTMQLARELLAEFPDTAAEVVCDKHGGRNQYAGLLTECFDVGLISTLVESRERSAYRFTWQGGTLTAAFSARAEAYLPVALASMASKYLREMAMQACNHFWGQRIDGLKPTAGYPLDAVRFKREIAAEQARLGIDDAAIWRVK